MKRGFCLESMEGDGGMASRIVPIIAAIFTFFILFAILTFILAQVEMSNLVKGLIKLAVPFVMANIAYNILAKRMKNS